jgi:hypothetical protein
VKTATTIVIIRSLSEKEIRTVINLQPEELVVLFAGSADVIEGTQLNRIHNGNIELSKSIMQPVSLLLAASVMVFGAIHLAAWNFAFPSWAECILWRVGSTAITTIPIPILLNAFISSRFYAMRIEVQDFQDSLLSIWEDYFAYWSTRQSPQKSTGTLSFPPPLPVIRLHLSEIGFEIPAWYEREQQLCQLVSRVWLSLALLLEASSDRQYIRHLFGWSLLVL